MEYKSKILEDIKSLQKTFGADIASLGAVTYNYKRVPFTSPRANLFVNGGMARNILIEFCGKEAGGKTTSSLDLCANMQVILKNEYNDEVKELNDKKKRTKVEEERLQLLNSRGPKRVLFVDCENTFNEEWATLLGVNCSEVIFLNPKEQSAEWIFQQILDWVATDELGMFIFDSLGVITSAKELEKSQEEFTMGGCAKAITRFTTRCLGLCKKYQTTGILINQVRDNFNSSYGGITTTGGHGLKHNVSNRIQFEIGGFFDIKGNKLAQKTNEAVCQTVMMYYLKNKTGRWKQRVSFYTLNYDKGIDIIADLIDVGLEHGLINGTSWYSFVNQETGEILVFHDKEKIQGRGKLYSFIEENKDIYDYLFKEVNKKLFPEKTVEEILVEYEEEIQGTEEVIEDVEVKDDLD